MMKICKMLAYAAGALVKKKIYMQLWPLVRALALINSVHKLCLIHIFNLHKKTYVNFGVQKIKICSLKSQQFEGRSLKRCRIPLKVRLPAALA
jgi:hypothetical protein